MAVLRTIVLTVLILIVLSAGVLLALPLFLNVESAREQIIAQVEDQTGLVLRLDGDISVSAFPQIAVSARSVGLAPARDQTEILEAGEVRFGLRLLPLMSGRVELSSLTLVTPEFTVGGGDDAAPGRGGESDALPVTSAELGRLQVDRFGIERGRLIVADQGSGEPTVVDDINLAGAFKALNEPTEFTGSFRFADTDHRLSVTLANIAELVDRGGSAASVALATDNLQVAATGHVWRIRGGSFDGRLTATVNSVDAVLKSYGQVPLPAELPFAVTMEAEIVADSNGFRVSGLKSKIGEVDASGDISLLVAGAKPELAAIVSVDRIDLAKFAAAVGKPADVRVPEAALPDLSPLSLIEADARLTIGTVDNEYAALNDVDTLIGLHGGRLQVKLLRASGLGGNATASVDIGAAEDGSAKLSGMLALDGIDAAQAMRLADVGAPVSGGLSSDLEFSAAGATPDALRRSLDVRGTVTLRDGSLSDLSLAEYFSDDPLADRIDDLSVSARITGLDRPFSIEGTGTWRKLAIKANANVAANSVMNGRPAPVELNLRSSLANVGYSGILSLEGLSADGTVSMETPSLVRLAQWAGRPLALAGGLNDFTIRGKLSVSGDRIAFNDADISVDGSRGGGALEANLSGAVPNVTARLAMQRLDLSPYLGGGSGSRSSGAESGWSDKPFDLSGLGAIDGDFQFSADEMIWGTMKAGRAELDLTIEKSVLSANLKQLALYDGDGKGRFDLRADGDVPSFAAEFDLAGLSLFPFFRDAAAFRRIEGFGEIRFSVTGSGRSQRQLVQSLGGKGAFDFQDGAIRGLNIPLMVRNLTSGALFGWQESESQSTDFSSLTASFSIDRGIAETSDLTLIGPLVRLTGAGTVNVPDQAVSFRVDPRVVANLQGQGGQTDLAGLGVPIVIEGPWAKPRIYPDIKGFLDDPQAALESLQNAGSTLLNARQGMQENTGGDAGSLLKQLLGRGKKEKQAVIPGNETAQSEKAGTPVAALPGDQAADGIGALIGQTDPAPIPRPRPDIVPPIESVGAQTRRNRQSNAQPVQPAEQATTEEKPAEPAGQAIDLLQNLLGQ